MNHLPKGTIHCPCHGERLLFEMRKYNLTDRKVKYPATKKSGNKEYYRAKCSVDKSNYTVEA